MLVDKDNYKEARDEVKNNPCKEKVYFESKG